MAVIDTYAGIIARANSWAASQAFTSPTTMTELSSAPAAPGSGIIAVYGMNDHMLRAKNSTNTEFNLMAWSRDVALAKLMPTSAGDRLVLGSGALPSSAGALLEFNSDGAAILMPRVPGLEVFFPSGYLTEGLLSYDSGSGQQRLRSYDGTRWVSYLTDQDSFYLGDLTGRDEDLLAGYAWLGGRGYGQIYRGGSEAYADFYLTTNPTNFKGVFYFGNNAWDEASNYLGLNTVVPGANLHVNGTVILEAFADGFLKVAGGAVYSDPTGGSGSSQWLRNSTDNYLYPATADDKVLVGTANGAETQTQLTVNVNGSSGNAVALFGKGSAVYQHIGNNGSVAFNGAADSGTATFKLQNILQRFVGYGSQVPLFEVPGDAVTSIAASKTGIFPIKTLAGTTYGVPYYAITSGGGSGAVGDSFANGTNITSINGRAATTGTGNWTEVRGTFGIISASGRAYSVGASRTGPGPTYAWLSGMGASGTVTGSFPVISNGAGVCFRINTSTHAMYHLQVTGGVWKWRYWNGTDWSVLDVNVGVTAANGDVWKVILGQGGTAANVHIYVGNGALPGSPSMTRTDMTLGTTNVAHGMFTDQFGITDGTAGVTWESFDYTTVTV